MEELGELASQIRPLLGKEKLDNNGQGSGYFACDSSSSSSSSSITFVLIFSTSVVYCSSFAHGNAIGYSSPAEYGILNDLGLTLAEYSVFASTLTIGSITCGVWSGKIADVIGRRGALGVSSLLCISGWLVIAFSKGAGCLNVGRFLVGCGTGISNFAVPVYVAEITPKDVRGMFMSVKPLMVSCGKAFFFLIGTLVNWRNLALIGCVPCILQLLSLLFIPESPRWLLILSQKRVLEEKMRIDQAEKSQNALYRLRGAKSDISKEIADVKDYTEYSKRVFGDGILSLFQRKYARCLIIGVGLVLFEQFGGLTGISFYTSMILQSAGFSSRIGSIAIAVTQIFAAILGVYFIDNFGRRPILLISATGTCLGCILLGLSFFFQNLQFGKDQTPILALAGLLVYFGFFSIGLEGIPWIISSEIIPINIKGPAGSIINVVSSSCGWIISYSFSFIFKWNSTGTFFIFAGISGASILFTWKMVPETKGRTLEELQASITNGAQ